MNFHAINGAAINGSAVMFNIVLLPDGAFGIDTVLFERNVALMEGSFGIELDMLGDVTRLAQLGEAPFGIDLEITGTLALDQNVYLTGSFDLAMDATGTLANVRHLSGEFTMALDIAGDPTNFASMAATFGIDFAWDAMLTAVHSIEPTSFGIANEMTGDLFVYRYLPNGTFGMALNMTGDLTSNPFGADPDDKVAVREPKILTADSV